MVENIQINFWTSESENTLKSALKSKLPVSNKMQVAAIAIEAVSKCLSRTFEKLVKSGVIIRFRIDWNNYYYPEEEGKHFFYRNKKYYENAPAKSLTEKWCKADLVLGYLTITYSVQKQNYPNFELVDRLGKIFWTFEEIRKEKLKTINKYKLKFSKVTLKKEFFNSPVTELSKDCQCRTVHLVPYLDDSWEWYIRFKCKYCGQTFFCECFREALKKFYPKALEEKKAYVENGWPHRFLKAYNNSGYKNSVCHLCRNIPSDILYCHPVYRNDTVVHYGPYIKKIAIEKDIDERDAENEIRDFIGIPRIGEQWKSEVELLNIVKSLFPNENIIHQAKFEWLGLQRIDIFIPRLRVGIEYHGLQHYQPVEFFGGTEGFQKTKERDRRKAELCKNNDVMLIYFSHEDAINEKGVESRIKNAVEGWLPMKN